MKKNQANTIRFVIVALLLLLQFNMYAQYNADDRRDNRTQWGIKGGLSFSNFYVDEVEDNSKTKVGFQAGIVARKTLIRKFLSVQTELLYTKKGIESEFFYAGQNNKQTLAMNYAEMPLLASVRILGLEFQGGVYGALLLRGKTVLNEEVVGVQDIGLRTEDFQTVDYGYVAGLSKKFGSLGVGVRYNHGLNEVAKSDVSKSFLGDSKNANLQLYVSLGIK